MPEIKMLNEETNIMIPRIRTITEDLLNFKIRLMIRRTPINEPIKENQPVSKACGKKKLPLRPLLPIIIERLVVHFISHASKLQSFDTLLLYLLMMCIGQQINTRKSTIINTKEIPQYSPKQYSRPANDLNFRLPLIKDIQTTMPNTMRIPMMSDIGKSFSSDL